MFRCNVLIAAQCHLMTVFSMLCSSLDTNMMCCHLTKEDADCISTFVETFASCENMLKNPAPRKSIWATGVLSLLGAVCVFVLRHFVKEKNIVQVIMLMHLAMADGLMGVYLITIAVIDTLWSGDYYLHDFQWRSSLYCQITGAISVLSSETSALLLTVISADRLKNIVFPYRGRKLTRRKAHILCMMVWVVGFIIAFLPISGIHYFKDPLGQSAYYSRSVVCLPLQLSARFPPGWEYSVAIFVGLNFLLIIFMIVAYAAIFLKSFLSNWRLARKGTKREVKARAKSSNALKRETALARRFFFIIFTDCACWMPIIVVGIRFLVEKDFYPSDDLPVWMAVLVLPINSALNPIIYTLSTPKVRHNT